MGWDKPKVEEVPVTRRRNKGVQFGERILAPEERSKKLPTDPHKRYETAHWGIKPDKVHDYWSDDPDLPPEPLVEMGKLTQLRVNPSVEGLETAWARSGRRKKYKMNFPRTCVLAFATTKDERCFLLLSDATCQRNARLLDDEADWVKLVDAADLAGGRQAEYTYPPLHVQVLGWCDAVCYKTHKKGDGPSEYIHHWGEDSGVKPLLCIDGGGRLWLAGGNYHCADEGITD